MDADTLTLLSDNYAVAYLRRSLRTPPAGARQL
jgi:hypothetical protein